MLKVIKTTDELKDIRNKISGTIGFVPTMGNLHRTNWFRHSGPARRVRLPGGPKDHCSHANHAILDDSHARPRDSSGRNTVGWQPGHHRSAPRARCHD
ncbi:MAG: hypothetical protein EB039_13370 [Proteobacteria bacterium]|nr:hypothetical protein [Pseudomonadota bacterium]